MSRPLLITDCDEVLLHMVQPWRQWLGDAHGIDFTLNGNDFSRAMHHQGSGEPVAPKQMWRLLDQFFVTEMGRQYPIAGAVHAINTLAETADVVVLTNLGDHHREARVEQLRSHGLNLKVYTNQGPKGPACSSMISRSITVRWRSLHPRFIASICAGNRCWRRTFPALTPRATLTRGSMTGPMPCRGWPPGLMEI
jgi:hypothetical protein